MISSKPLALDLFCGGGGTCLGLQAAGFEVVGVDINSRHGHVYPGHFICGDILTLPMDLSQFDFIWASPPCQRFSYQLGNRPKIAEQHPDLIEPTRVIVSVAPFWCIENVAKAPLKKTFSLTGPQVGLPKLWRRRIFEANFFLLEPPCMPRPKEIVSVSQSGGIGTKSRAARVSRNLNPDRYAKREMAKAMGLYPTEMTMRQIGEAVPPAYAEYIGRHVMSLLK